MTDKIAQLIGILELERLETDLFRGHSPNTRVQRVFGGQVIGQALAAAYQTVPEDRTCHSLHAYFIHGGDPSVPIIYQVEEARDGRSFTTRRVIAIQHGRAIFNLACSFQVEEKGYEHQLPMPPAPDPMDAISYQQIADDVEKRGNPSPDMLKLLRRDWEMDMRFVDPPDYLDIQPMSDKNQVWMRLNSKVEVSERMHQCMLAYMSDMTLLNAGARPHAVAFETQTAQIASLDHAMWFHAPARADEWFLYDKDSPAGMGGRTFNRGSMFSQDGRLIASVAQEGLMRPLRKTPEN